MKFRVIALTLVLTVVSWAQKSSQTLPVNPDKPGTTPAATAAACHHGGAKDASCCTNMKGMDKDSKLCCAHQDAASDKDGMACCHQEAKDGEEAMSCSKGKDGKACMKQDKSANASTVAGCCPDGDCCGKGKACCGSEKNASTAAKSGCCGDHCEMSGHAETAMK